MVPATYMQWDNIYITDFFFLNQKVFFFFNYKPLGLEVDNKTISLNANCVIIFAVTFW